jgi:hypothetical protein
VSTPAPPNLDYAFTIEADIGAPRSAASGPLGTRLHIPITGGRVTGPKLQGRILSGGSDWALVRHDGHSIIDARYTIEADDGIPIMVRSRGLRVSSPTVAARLRAGEPVADDEVYFRAQPSFEAPAQGRHAWLNDRLFVARLRRTASGVTLEVFVVA